MVFRNVREWLYTTRFFSIIGLLIGGPLIDKLDTKKTAITVLLPLSLSVFVLLIF